MKLIILITILTFNLFSKNLIEILEEELNHSKNGLINQTVQPYYIAFAVTETIELNLSSEFGFLLNDNYSQMRTLDMDIRVGDYNLDNTHIIRGESFNFSSGNYSPNLALDDNENSIKQTIWKSFDKNYKDAIERYDKVITNKKVKIKEEDESNDFSKEKPRIDIQKLDTFFNVNKEYYINLIKELSKTFSDYNFLYEGNVSINFSLLNKYFVDTEGNKLQWSEPSIRLMIYSKTKAEDGMSLPLYKSYFSYTQENLPKLEIIKKDIKELIQILTNLKDAKMAETYTGPVILSGEASGVFFHEIFGHRVEGHREKDPSSSQTFKQMVGKEILPNFISVIFDPTLKKYKGYELSGFYDYDDQGIKSERVISVENGVFKRFLMSRNPIKDFDNSNGHGRREPGRMAVSRQSNLIVESTKKVPYSVLRQELIEICKKENKEYGLFIDVVQGGFTFTNRTIPNAFNVLPLVVYKIYTDGREDELVRGVDLIGTPLTTFSNIIMTSDDFGVFNGICGAESGGVPVSACSPSLLVSKIEVQKKQKSQAKLPILESPKVGDLTE